MTENKRGYIQTEKVKRKLPFAKNFSESCKQVISCFGGTRFRDKIKYLIYTTFLCSFEHFRN